MGLFIFMAILGLLGIAALVIGMRMGVKLKRDDSTIRDEDDYLIGKRIVYAVGAAFLAISLIVIGLSSYTIVPARNLGVPVSLGQPGDVVNNGFHAIAPWANVETFDATVQTLSVDQAVRLGNGGTATVDASIQWQIDTTKNNFLSLYRQYRTFPNIQANVIQRDFAAALNDVFETFNPLAVVGADGQITVQMSDLATKVLAEMTSAVPVGLIVSNPKILPPKYSKAIEDQIGLMINATTDTRIAEQKRKTAQLIADANNLLAKGDLTPGVLYQNCLNLVRDMGANLPPAFSCGAPGANVVIATAK
jgi:regulator of protease activity HflC (stomatin/prohibitin superfamily)